MSAFLRLLAFLCVLAGLAAFYLMNAIPGWERVERDGPAYLAPWGDGTLAIKAGIVPYFGQIGGGAIGLGIVLLILSGFARRPAPAYSGGRVSFDPEPPRGSRIPLFLFAIVIGLCGTIGWTWWRYVTAGESPYDEVGIALNSRMPLPVRRWGCAQIAARFPRQIPPYGCGAAGESI